MRTVFASSTVFPVIGEHVYAKCLKFKHYSKVHSEHELIAFLYGLTNNIG